MGLLLLGQWHTLQDTLILCLRLLRLRGGGVGDMTPGIKTFLTVGLQIISFFVSFFFFSFFLFFFSFFFFFSYREFCGQRNQGIEAHPVFLISFSLSSVLFLFSLSTERVRDRSNA